MRVPWDGTEVGSAISQEPEGPADNLSLKTGRSAENSLELQQRCVFDLSFSKTEEL
jgi:hypothetical protein